MSDHGAVDTDDLDSSAREIARLMAAQGKFSLAERRRILSILLPPQHRRAVIRFSIMLGLSVAVAVMGLSADSSSVVIGAMLIAPLMTPVLTFAAAVGLGLPQRAAQAGFLVLLGSAASVMLAWLLAGLLPEVTIGAEILGRTKPDVRDLIVAVAAGAAGAYATAREDISAALPGVAVAVALVPPLAATGVLLQDGQTELARGSGLLFIVNLLAIFVAALLVFFVTGVIPTIRLCLSSPRLSVTVVAVVLAMVLIGIPLTAQSVDAARSSQNLGDIRNEVQAWVSGHDLDVDDVDVTGKVVTVALVGTVAPPDAFLLAKALVDEVGTDVEVIVRWSQRVQGEARADTPPSSVISVIDAATGPVEDWLAALSVGGTSFELLDLQSDEGSVDITVGGPVAPPTSSTLADEIAVRYGGPVQVDLLWVQQLAVDGSGRTSQQRGELLVAAWVGARPDVRLLDVRVGEALVTIDLATDGDPVGLDVLERLASGLLSDPVEVTIRTVPLVAAEPVAVVQAQPIVD